MITVLGLFVLATGILPRAAATVQSDLSTLNNDYSNLTKSLQAYTGNAQSFVNVYNAFNYVDRDTNITRNDTQAGPVFTATVAQNILSYIRNTLEPSINTATKTYTAKRPQISSAFATYFDGRLKQIRADSGTLGSALISKSTVSTTKTGLQQVFQKIDADFAAALKGTSAGTRDVGHMFARRDTAQILADLKNINSLCMTVLSKINAWNGGMANTLAIQNSLDNLDAALKRLATDTNNTGPLTEGQVRAIVDYINNVVRPCINTLMSALVAKKTKFQEVGLSSTVKNGIITLRDDERSFGNALIARSPASQKSAVQQAQNAIAAEFQKGITAFS